MWQLNLPSYQYNVKKTDNRWMIFDSLRKKFVTLTPEEWVRQHFLNYLINSKRYPAALIAVEQQIELNGLRKRCDAVLYNRDRKAVAIFEFKAPQITIGQDTFDQVAVYNSKLQLNLIFISNGVQHYFARLSDNRTTYLIQEAIPDYEELFPDKG
jgi:hypothetical protein